MSCEDFVCGTGTWQGPQPGDPDNNVSIHALPAFGGIDVSWTYPSTNSHAVAHTLLYRGVSPDREISIQLAVVSGNSYYDRIEKETQHHYWIRIVSVNGTVGEWVGPAVATSRERRDDTLDDITGSINSGVLATTLRSEIDRISLNHTAILKEVDDRIAASTALSGAWDIINQRTNQVETFILNEVEERVEGDSALARQLSLVAAANETNTALIVEERIARVTKDDAFAQAQLALDSQINNPTTGLAATRSTLINTYYTKVGTDSAIAAANLTLSSVLNHPTTGLAATRSVLLNDYYTKAGTNSAISFATLGLVSQTGLNNALSAYTNTAALQNTYYTKTDTNSAISSATINLASKTELGKFAITADIQRDYYTKTSTDGAIASANIAAQSTIDGQISAVQIGLQTNINTLSGKVTNIGALYTAKVSVNGLIGGFGVYNDGTFVEAGFEVDRFWIGRTGSDRVLPFIVDAGTVYINKARIRNADIDTLKIAGNAVTVPKVDYRIDLVTGNGAPTDVSSVVIHLIEPGWVYAMFTANQTYGTGLRVSSTTLYIGPEGTTVGGAAVTTNIAVSMARYLPAGSHYIVARWTGENSGVRISERSLFVLGAMR